MEELSASAVSAQITKAEGHFNAIWTRMDDDFEKWALTPQPGIDYDVASKLITTNRDEDVTITSNTLRTFADEVHSKLASADMQISVHMAESEGDYREDIGKLERLFQYAFERADERLQAKVQLPFRDQTIWYANIRGFVAASILVYKIGKDVIFAFEPLDPRWLTYEIGSNGLAWSGYKTYRSSTALKEEYGEDTNSDKEDNEVIDYFKCIEPGTILNGVICDGRWFKEPEVLNADSMPVIILPAPTRPYIRTIGTDRGSYGDSIFAAIRDINTIRDKFASIVATHANIMSKQPLINYRDLQGKDLQDTIQYAGGILNLPAAHNKIEPMPMKEISPTVVDMLRWLEGQVEDGSLPKSRISTPSPQSGTLEGLVQEARNIVFNPQLRLLKTFYSMICRLVEEQLLKGGVSGGKISKVDVKTERKLKYYETSVKPVDLKKPHIVKVEFVARTPWTQLDVYQVADMAKRLGLPDGFIQEYILKLPDPKGLGDQSAIEMAEHSPKLAIVRAIQALMKQERVDEAQQLIRDLYTMEMQEQMGTPEAAEKA